MKTTHKIILAGMVLSLTGCAADSQHSAYRAALQKAVDQKMTTMMGGTGICLPVSDSSSLSGDAYIAHQCLKQTPKGYAFSMPEKMLNSDKDIFDSFIKNGYIKYGAPYTCHYTASEMFGGTADKQAVMRPVAIKNKDLRFSVHHVNEVFGPVQRGSLCVGHFEVTKIETATDPHFNSQYSMKTVAVVADIGIKGVIRLGKDSPLLKSAPSALKNGNAIKEHVFTISAILGEAAKGHWKTLKVTDLKAAAQPKS